MNKIVDSSKKIIKEKVIDRRAEIFRYGIVGVIGTVLDVIVFFVAIEINTPQIIAQWLAALVGATHNHIWQHYYIFKHNQKFSRTYFWSMILSILSIIISGPYLSVLNSFIQIIWLSKLILIASTALVLYIIRRKWIFINNDKSSE